MSEQKLSELQAEVEPHNPPPFQKWEHPKSRRVSFLTLCQLWKVQGESEPSRVFTGGKWGVQGVVQEVAQLLLKNRYLWPP